jgi:hypothetical protein
MMKRRMKTAMMRMRRVMTTASSSQMMRLARWVGMWVAAESD